MFDALYIGATGMQAQQLNVDTIANNLVNVNTAGFKKGRVAFTDLMVQEAARLAQPAATEAIGPLNEMRRMGAGVGVSSVAKLFDSGDIRKTDSAMDIAVQGDGFMEVILPDGSRAYAKGGTLKINRDNQLANSAGYALKPNLTIPENTESLTISREGRVDVRLVGQNNAMEIGQIELVRFANTSGLVAMGDNMYRSSEASGEPIIGRAGEEGTGVIVQGYLEGSNVKMVDEMVNLMVAQRAYEASAKLVQAADEMQALVNGLRK